MLIMLLVTAIIVAVGTRASDAIQVKQQEVILANLPEAQAIAYYEVIRRRVRKVAILRVIAFASLAVMFYSYKHKLAHQAAPPGKGAPAEMQRR